MNSFTLRNDDILSQIAKKEKEIKDLKDSLDQSIFDLQKLMRSNAENVTIQWKESINWCLSVDSDKEKYFLKTPSFVAKCVAHKYGVEVTRDVKNKVSTTLSIMYNQGIIGRIKWNGKSFYGLKSFFEKFDHSKLKKTYMDKLDLLDKSQ